MFITKKFDNSTLYDDGTYYVVHNDNGINFTHLPSPKNWREALELAKFIATVDKAVKEELPISSMKWDQSNLTVTFDLSGKFLSEQYSLSNQIHQEYCTIPMQVVNKVAALFVTQ